MKIASQWLPLALLGFSSSVHSFPTSEYIKTLNPSNEEIHKALLQLRDKQATTSTNCSTPIDVTGEHAFKAPDFAAGDQRGPCPGLNALANHGYLPRDGIASFTDVIGAVNQVYGMSVELGTVLSLMGTVWVGNPLSLDPGFSIGGPSSKVNNILGNLLGLLGTPRGLSGSHNFIEADSSNTRQDLYVTGDANTLDMDLFLEAYNSVPGDVITFDDIGDRMAKRLEVSKATNPYFWYGPYTGLVVRNAGFAFAARLLSNHSDEYPMGQLTKSVFKSFWGVYDDPSSPSGLTYRKGQEQIPQNWYRLPMEYSLVSLNLDLVAWSLKHPSLLSVGGNTGTVNSFAGVDTTDLLGGLVNLSTLLEGNNLICFTLEVVKTFAPNSLSSLFKTLEKPLSLVTDTLAAPLLDLGCPEYKDLEAGGSDLFSELLDRFPGAKKAGSVL